MVLVAPIPADVSNIRHFYDYENMQITCQDERETAVQYFLQIKSHLKRTEEERQKITKPLNEALRSTNELFKRITDPLNKIKDKLESRMASFADSERKRLVDEERKKREAAKKEFEDQAKAAKREAIELGSETALETANNFQKRADEVDTQNVQVSQTVRFWSIGTLAERRVWKWRLLDINLVPDEYFQLNEKSINSKAKEFGEKQIQIPGIEIYQETGFSALTK